MSLTAAVTAFVIILPAELPDKTAFACLVMGSRYRPSFVFAGAAAAFAAHAAVAVAVGGLLGLLPHRPLQMAVGVMFAVGAVLLLRQRPNGTDAHFEAKDTRAGFLPVAGTGFVVILAAEFGDLTQFVTANLAAKYHDPVAVGIGATLALWAVAGIAVTGGHSLLKVIPIAWLSRGAALIMLTLAGTSLATALS